MLFNNFFVPVPIGGISGLSQLKQNQEKSEEVLKADNFVERETTYFKENISKIASADEFIEDTRILRYSLAAYGLEEELFKTAFIKQIIESDLSDPQSAVNRISDPRWQSFAQAFVKSSADVPGPLQDDFANKQIIKSYAIELSRYKTDAEIDTLHEEAETFRTLMKDITRPEDLSDIKNRDALKFLKNTFGLEDENFSDSEIIDFLSGSAPPEETPNGWKNAHAALSFFDETDLDPDSVNLIPNSDKVIEDIVKLRYENELGIETGYKDYTLKAEAFSEALNLVYENDNLDSFLADDDSLLFLKEAYSLQNDTTDIETIKKYLAAPEYTEEEIAGFPELGEDAPTIYLTPTEAENMPTNWQLMRNDLRLHIAPDLDSLDAAIEALEDSLVDKAENVVKRHKTKEFRFGSDIDRMDRLKKEADYFAENIGFQADSDSSGNFNAELSNQKLVNNGRLMRFALKSFGISTTTIDSSKLAKVLNNEYNFNVNLESDKKLREFQKAYSFTISQNSLKNLDDGFGDTIEDAFIEQTFISAVGNSDPDLRLALYFENRIGEVASQDGIDNDNLGWLKILGEQPLATAFQRVFSLPSSIGTLDIDQQKEIYSSRAENVLGDSNVSRFSDKQYRDDFISLFLTRSAGQSLGFNTSSASIASTILNGG